MSQFKLVIAEKPSVAQALSAVLGATSRKDGFMEGNGYLVSWCIGHLLGLASADAYDEKYNNWRYGDLPILPAEWKHVAASDRKKQLGVLSALMKRADVECVVNACDAGREGELIFRLVYEHCGCTKDGGRLPPIHRLWISSMEDTAIREGFANLRPGADYDSLYAAALCREKADWLVGINGTRTFSLLYGGATLNVGRVVSPTLAMLVQREAEIAAFVKEPFYTIELDAGVLTAASARMQDKAQAERLRATCDGVSATVVSVEQEDKTAAPPKLYDLTTLQREANRLWGYTAQQTLDYAQALYDKKLATYPRTDSRFLTGDMADAIPVLVNLSALIVPGVRGSVPIGIDGVGRVVNDKKVADHHAIIPTKEIKDADLGSLPAGERNILHMLALRLVCAVQEPQTWAETTTVLDCGGLRFTAKGKTVTADGWKAVEQAYRNTLKEKPEPEDGDDDPDEPLPDLADGQVFENIRASLKEGFTSPPKHFTEDLLLAAMETAGAGETDDDVERRGLGTSATRASIIEKLVKGGFAERRKKALLPTKKGVNLITVLPESVKSPQLTAEWENRLKQVERGELAAADFMEGIAAFTAALVRDNSAPIPEYAALFPRLVSAKGEVVGVCPRCGGEIHEGGKGFFCADSAACGFKLWKDNRFFTAKKKPLTKAIVKALLKDGRVAMNGLHSEKTGKTYDATVVMEPGEKGGKYVNFRLEFEKRVAK